MNEQDVPQVDFDPLEALLQDPEITEIMVNSTNAIYFEKRGQMQLANGNFETEEQVVGVIRAIAASVGRVVDEKNPVVDGRLADGSRFNAVIRPIAVTGPTLTLRKYHLPQLTWDDLLRFGSLSRPMYEFLKACVAARINIAVSGGTASGKTTIINALSEFIPDTERIVTVENVAELQLRHPHVISLEARPANPSGEGEVSMAALLRNAQRMRADRIISSEIHEGDAWEMLHAMTNGHDGSMFTIHADSVQDVLDRLEMVITAGTGLPLTQIRARIAQGVKLITQQNYLPNKRRRITSITEIVGLAQGQYDTREIFRYVADRDSEAHFVVVDRPTFADRLDLPDEFFSTGK